ncbi:hypothetical protein V5O48_013820 [Marasmius crinis-equi]|uniref:DUF6593 domain-containing protein n=1 Tax=Marasmius crinis-equi TaxID=585013 RepID=A0ABR3EZ11_9AGAR
MDLIISEDDRAKTTTFSLATGQPVYQVTVQSRGSFRSETRTISKFQHPGAPPTDIGMVELHSMSSDICQFWGRDIRPRTDMNSLSGAKGFTSSVNGQQYKWKRKLKKAELTDKFRNTVAVYEDSRSGRLSSKGKTPAKLSVTPAAMGFLDEIIVTFVYIEQKIKEEAEVIGAAGEVVGAVAGA